MLRLSELLERLRPTGTPGAPTEGEQQRHRELREREIATVTATLERFEAAAEQVIATGRAEADRVRQDGERQAARIRAQLPDRIAIARAHATRDDEEHGDDEIARVRHEADDEIARIEADAQTQIPRLVDAVVATIWSTIAAATNDTVHAPDTGGRP
jgi:vacuolar-type H+-ATPase subunit H